MYTTGELEDIMTAYITKKLCGTDYEGNEIEKVLVEVDYDEGGMVGSPSKNINVFIRVEGNKEWLEIQPENKPTRCIST